MDFEEKVEEIFRKNGKKTHIKKKNWSKYFIRLSYIIGIIFWYLAFVIIF